MSYTDLMRCALTLAQVLAREALVWRQLKHPNLLSLLGLRRTEDDQTDLISPYVQDGTLRDFLARSGSISINQRDALVCVLCRYTCD
jgi:hypothetical protein